MNMDILDIQALLDGSATVKSRIRVIAENGLPEIILDEDNSIVNWLYKDTRYLENEGFIGQFIGRSLDGKLQNISDDFSIENRKIELFMGITRSGMNGSFLSTEELNEMVTEGGNNIITEGTEGGQTTWYSFGTFIVDKPKDNEVKDNTTFTSMDYTTLFNTTFNPEYVDSTYIKSFREKLDDEETVTALWLLQYVCKQCGVQLGSQTFTNDDFVIDSNQFDSTSNCRDVVKAIAKLAYSWARIGWDDKLYIDFEQGDPEAVEEYNTITADEYYNLTTQKKKYGPINKVVIGSSIVEGMNAYIEDSESISENGLHELDIYDNPLLYSLDMLEDIKDTAQVLLGLEYVPIETQTIGHPWLKGNELIKIKDMENNYKYTYPFNREIEYFGHIKTKLNAYAQTDVEQAYTYNGDDSDSTFKKVTKVRLDRDEQTLNVYMEKTDDNISDITDLNLGLDGLSLRVTSTEGDISNIQSDILDIHNQIDGAITFYSRADTPPTLSNEPASNWDPQQYDDHLGDICDVIQNSQIIGSYKFVYDNNEYKWVIISDSEIASLRNDLQNFESNVATTYVTNSTFTTSNNQIYSQISSTETTVKVYADNQANSAKNDAKTYAAGVANTAESNAKTYADGVGSTAENNAKGYTDGEITTAKDYTDTKASTAENNAKDYADTVASAAETNSKSYTDGIKTTLDGDIAAVQTSAESYADSVSSTAESNAKSYTDGEITSTKTYADGKANTAETNAKNYADGVGTAAQTYADGVASTAETNAKTYTDGIETALSADIDTAEQNAKDYADDGISAAATELTDNISSATNSLSNRISPLETSVDTLTANQENFATKVSLEVLTQSVTTLQTNTYTKTEINTKLTDGSVTKVDTTTGFTMDATGFHVDKTGAETNSTLDEKGLSVKDSGGNDVSYQGYVDSAKVVDNPNLVAYEGQTVTYQENAVINHYLQLPNSRIEEYSGGTGVFFTG